jgi:hypothetical protein
MISDDLEQPLGPNEYSHPYDGQFDLNDLAAQEFEADLQSRAEMYVYDCPHHIKEETDRFLVIIRSLGPPWRIRF